MTLLLGQSFVYFLALLLAHAGFLRFWGPNRYVSRALAAYFFFALILILDSLRRGLPWDRTLIACVTVGLLWALKMSVIVNLLNSVSFRMVRAIVDSPDQRLSAAEFAEHLSEDTLFSMRLEMLLSSGMITRSNDAKYTLTDKGFNLANLFSVVQRAFRLGTVG